MATSLAVAAAVQGTVQAEHDEEMFDLLTEDGQPLNKQAGPLLGQHRQLLLATAHS
jgi:hypothetical protein